MREPLTTTQQEVYNFIVEFIRKNKYSPTVREIMARFDWQSANSAAVHLKNLKAKGYITNASKDGKLKSRTIRLVDDIIGNYTIDGNFLNKALKQLNERGYSLDHNTAIEFLRELEVNIV